VSNSGRVKGSATQAQPEADRQIRQALTDL